MWYSRVYNQTASDAWRYNNPVYKLMTDKLQLMLINVLLDRFLNIKVSQASIATRLRCNRVMESLMINSLHNHCWVRRWKKYWKSVNPCRSYGQRHGHLYYKNRCTRHTFITGKRQWSFMELVVINHEITATAHQRCEVLMGCRIIIKQVVVIIEQKAASRPISFYSVLLKYGLKVTLGYWQH